MEGPPDITLSELRAAVGRLFDAVEEQLGEELRFPVDYYWEVLDPYSIYEKPETAMGQVSDDAASVREFLDQPTDDFVVIQHESGHVRGVLQALEYLSSQVR